MLNEWLVCLAKDDEWIMNPGLIPRIEFDSRDTHYPVGVYYHKDGCQDKQVVLKELLRTCKYYKWLAVTKYFFFMNHFRNGIPRGMTAGDVAIDTETSEVWICGPEKWEKTDRVVDQFHMEELIHQNTRLPSEWGIGGFDNE